MQKEHPGEKALHKDGDHRIQGARCGHHCSYVSRRDAHGLEFLAVARPSEPQEETDTNNQKKSNDNQSLFFHHSPIAFLTVTPAILQCVSCVLLKKGD